MNAISFPPALRRLRRAGRAGKKVRPDRRHDAPAQPRRFSVPGRRAQKTHDATFGRPFRSRALIFLANFRTSAARDTNGNFNAAGGFADELFIGVTAPSAQLMIEMGNGQFPPMPHRKQSKNLQQRHRIQSAGNRHQNRLTAFQQPPALNILFDALEQIGHAVMLLHGRIEARLRRLGERALVQTAALEASNHELHCISRRPPRPHSLRVGTTRAPNFKLKHTQNLKSISP